MTNLTKILNDATTTGASSVLPNTAYTVQAIGSTTSGTGTASIDIQVSNNGDTWLTLSTVTLALGTTATNDGFANTAPWGYFRANVTALTGTGAKVTVIFGA